MLIIYIIIIYVIIVFYIRKLKTRTNNIISSLTLFLLLHHVAALRMTSVVPSTIYCGTTGARDWISECQHGEQGSVRTCFGSSQSAVVMPAPKTVCILGGGAETIVYFYICARHSISFTRWVYLIFLGLEGMAYEPWWWAKLGPFSVRVPGIPVLYHQGVYTI